MIFIKKILPSVILFCAIIFVWQGTIAFDVVSYHLLPKPSDIITALFNNFDILTSHILQTLLETIIGLVIAIVLGVLTAILLDMSSLIRKAVYPLLITSQTIPMIALAPLLLLWFGFDLTPKVIIVVLSCFFPITIATLDGFAHIDHDFTKLLQSMHATYWQTMKYVKLPGALPQFFSGLKIAATYSVTGAIVGEYVGAYQGLGIYMQEVAHSHVLSLVFATITVIAMLSLLLFGVVLFIERIVLSYKY